MQNIFIFLLVISITGCHNVINIESNQDNIFDSSKIVNNEDISYMIIFDNLKYIQNLDNKTDTLRSAYNSYLRNGYLIQGLSFCDANSNSRIYVTISSRKGECSRIGKIWKNQFIHESECSSSSIMDLPERCDATPSERSQEVLFQKRR